MIEAIEALLVHWGDQLTKAGSAGGLGSAMGSIVEWKGAAPRGGQGGSKLLLAGAGPDFVAGEVEAALAAVGRWEGGELLCRLAHRRYSFRPALTVDQQVQDLALGAGDAGRRAYTRLVHRLHELVEVALTARLVRQDELLKKSKKGGDRVRALATKREPDAALRAAGDRFRSSRSSGDSDTFGGIEPRSASKGKNR